MWYLWGIAGGIEMIEEQEFTQALGRQRDLMDRLIVVEGVDKRNRVSGELSRTWP